MVLSRLLRLLLGLVIVVPRLACRPCPRRKGAAEGEVGDAGEPGVPGVTGEGDDDAEPLDRAASRPDVRPLAETGAVASSAGVDGCDASALPSSESASNNSGGRRSFSMSDFRL